MMKSLSYEKQKWSFFTKSIDIDLWEYVLEDPFVPVHFVDNEVMNKVDHKRKERSVTRV